jgi:hypothetical protein
LSQLTPSPGLWRLLLIQRIRHVGTTIFGEPAVGNGVSPPWLGTRGRTSADRRVTLAK